PRRVPRIPARDDRRRPPRPRAKGGEQFRIRPEDAPPRCRLVAGAARRERDGRDDAPWCPRDRCRPELDDREAVRRHHDLRAPPAPIRDQPGVYPEARGRGPPIRRSIRRRTKDGGPRIERPSILRRIAVPPRVAIPSGGLPQSISASFAPRHASSQTFKPTRALVALRVFFRL